LSTALDARRGLDERARRRRPHAGPGDRGHGIAEQGFFDLGKVAVLMLKPAARIPYDDI
jgi:hypothetical protein